MTPFNELRRQAELVVLRLRLEYTMSCIDAELKLAHASLEEIRRGKRARRRLLARMRIFARRLRQLA
jgi:hypothetical protein